MKISQIIKIAKKITASYEDLKACFISVMEDACPENDGYSMLERADRENDDPTFIEKSWQKINEDIAEFIEDNYGDFEEMSQSDQRKAMIDAIDAYGKEIFGQGFDD